VASWRDVDELSARLPGTVLGQAHEGSPAWYAGRHQFARLRWDEDGRELLQYWTGEMDTERALADRRDVFPWIATYSFRVSVWAYLDRLTVREVAEVLLDSYGVRGGARRRASVDPAAFLPPG
jgi:hypothetical protein